MSSAEKIIFLGGSFDPLHYGHTQMLSQLLTNHFFQRVVVVPAMAAPHKLENPPSPYYHRMHLLKIFKRNLQENLRSRLIISVAEKLLPRPGYSWRTIEFLKTKTQAAIYMAIGADMLPGLDRWANSSYLKENCIFYVFTRNPEKVNSSFLMQETNPNDLTPILTEDGFSICWANNPGWEVSSSEIRRQLKDFYKTKDAALVTKNIDLAVEVFIAKNHSALQKIKDAAVTQTFKQTLKYIFRKQLYY